MKCVTASVRTWMLVHRLMGVLIILNRAMNSGDPQADALQITPITGL